MKSFLVSVGGAGSDDSVLETAMAAAQPFAARLNLLHVQVDAGQAARHSPHADFATGPALRGALADLETEAKVRTSAAEQHVRDFCTRSNITMLNAPSPTLLAGDAKEGMTASWRVEEDDAVQRILFHARHNDLVIVGRANKPNGLPPDFTELLLVGSGRPVLIASAKAPRTLTGTVMVCWKESAEASRAVAAAMPLLRKAERAIFASVADESDGIGESMEEIARQCAWNGIAAETKIIGPNGRPAQDMLRAAAQACEADLIVMGAYGHSRLREMLFGGCTRAFISHADKPVLLMH